MWFNRLLTHGDIDGVEFGGGEVGAGDDEEAGEKAKPELAGLHGADALEQLGVKADAGAGAVRHLPTTLHCSSRRAQKQRRLTVYLRTEYSSAQRAMFFLYTKNEFKIFDALVKIKVNYLLLV